MIDALMARIERYASWAWSRHYLVPRMVYLLALLLSLALLAALWPLNTSVESELYILTGLLLVAILGLAGLVRWFVESRGVILVVACFQEVADSHLEGGQRTSDLQRQVVAQIREALTPAYPLRILAPKETLGTGDFRLAARMRRRLRAGFLLYGDLVVEHGRHRTNARLLRPLPKRIWFYDRDTQQMTFYRPVLQDLSLIVGSGRVASSSRISLELGRELERFLRSVEGMLLLAAGRFVLAESVLKEALADSQRAESQVVDEICLNLAHSYLWQGKTDEAIDILKTRARIATVDAELLRLLAVLSLPSGHQHARNEFSLRLLRRAADRADDPQRELSLLYLAMLLADSEIDDGEADQIIERLSHSPSGDLKRAWFVQKLEGDRHWRQARKLQNKKRREELAVAAASAASNAYRRAIRSYPRWARLGWRLHRVPLSPQLLAAAADAERASGHQRRAERLFGREQKSRHLWLTRAEEAIVGREWAKTIVFARRAVTGRMDHADLHALAVLSVGEESVGHRETAARCIRFARRISDAHATEVQEGAREASRLFESRDAVNREWRWPQRELPGAEPLPR